MVRRTGCSTSASSADQAAPPRRAERISPALWPVEQGVQTKGNVMTRTSRFGVRMVLAAVLTLPLVAGTGAVSASPDVAKPLSTTSGATSSAVNLPEGGHGRIRPLPFLTQRIRGHYIAVFRDQAMARQSARALARYLVRQHP